MLVLAAVGAVVLALVSWAALREAQRLPRSFPIGAQANAVASVRARHPGAQPASANPARGGPAPASSRVQVVGDATVADADTDEALAAAAALWHVLVDRDRS